MTKPYTLLIIFLLMVSSAGFAAHRTYERLDTGSQVIYDLCFSTYGEVLVVADHNIVKLFDFKKRILLSQLEGAHETTILAVDMSADSTLVASGDRNGAVRLWDLSTNTVRYALDLPGEAIIDLSLSGQYLAVATSGNRMVILNVTSGKIEKEFMRSDDVLSVKFNSEGTILAAGAADNNIEFIDMSTMQVVSTLSAHRNWVRAIDFNVTGNQFISGDDQGRIYTRRFSGTNVGLVLNRKKEKGWITSIDSLEDDVSFAVSTSAGMVIINSPFNILKMNLGVMVYGVKMKPNNKNVIMAAVATHGRGVLIVEGEQF